MSHRIKLRAWDAERRCFYYSTQPGVDFVFGKMGDGVYIDNLLRLDLTDENTSQFTGVEDENGVEVCEGDIGLIGTTQYTVCWNEAGAFFDLAWENSTDMDTDLLLSDAVNGFPVFEVIGNRFENPELLEVIS
ncbi:YopX family protein [Rhodococcus erythropolis]|uniref:YopX protein domain-containing protein n=1 Tax=Rhodococcus erythropolis (strain PR4 / NBRC 100887) TaxID=234621 RepID=C0ZXX5_RHOE4|nr:YopX family protein [Rhodococcus erythropolis]BAH33210.1 hypothetical protein RER_25020 [Rhodococcus erythropolis PR4]